jgi:hypothetical protein
LTLEEINALRAVPQMSHVGGRTTIEMTSITMYEHGGPSKGLLVVDLSSEEEDATPNTSRDEEIAQKLFGALNRGLLGPPDDENIIILSDSMPGPTRGSSSGAPLKYRIVYTALVGQLC